MKWMDDIASSLDASRRRTKAHNMLHQVTKPDSSRLLAIVETMIVTLIWSSSFVMVKIVLAYTGPLMIAGLRYFIAALFLVPLIIHRSSTGRAGTQLSANLWLQLLLLGITAYTVANGALFWSLRYLSATTLSFLQSLSPLLVLVSAILWLQEFPTRAQLVGLAVCVVGAMLFFAPGLATPELTGIAIAAIGLFSFNVFNILGRSIARDRRVDTVSLTAIPLALGGGLLLMLAVPLEGLPRLPASGWTIILSLALVNTALAYLLYNHALRILTALEVSTMMNLSPLVTAGLSYIILGETLEPVQIAGMLTVISGVTLVQWKRAGRQAREPLSPVREPTSS